MREVMLCEQLPTMPVAILPSDLESIDARVSHLNVIGMSASERHNIAIESINRMTITLHSHHHHHHHHHHLSTRQMRLKRMLCFMKQKIIVVHNPINCGMYVLNDYKQERQLLIPPSHACVCVGLLALSL
jgi:hypothetical protein